MLSDMYGVEARVGDWRFRPDVHRLARRPLFE